MERLHAASAALATALTAQVAPLEHVAVDCHAASPIAHVRLTPAAAQVLSIRQQERMLRAVALVTAKSREGAAVQLMMHSSLAHIQAPAPPSLRLTAHCDVAPSALDGVAHALAQALREELGRLTSALALPRATSARARCAVRSRSSRSSRTHGNACASVCSLRVVLVK